MRIDFDFFILFPDLKDGLNLEERLSFGEMINLFVERLSILKDEIDAVEKSDQFAYIIIETLPKDLRDQPSDKINISTRGYPDNLKNKIEESFNENDFILLNKRLDEISGRFRN